MGDGDQRLRPSLFSFAPQRRRTVFGHSVASFIFNAALLALTVNIAASAI